MNTSDSAEHRPIVIFAHFGAASILLGIAYAWIAFCRRETIDSSAAFIPMPILMLLAGRFLGQGELLLRQRQQGHVANRQASGATKPVKPTH